MCIGIHFKSADTADEILYDRVDKFLMIHNRIIASLADVCKIDLANGHVLLYSNFDFVKVIYHK